MSSDARAGEQQPQLRVGLLALGLRARQRELGVGGVEPRDEVAGLDAIAFGDAELEHRPPTWAATCTSVASTWPETRTRSAGGLSRHAAAAATTSGETARGIFAERCGV